LANLQKTAWDTIYLKADFKTLFNGYNITGGHYGLRLSGILSDESRFDKVLDSSMMFGNPYDYMVPFSQDILFYVPHDPGVTINSMTLSVYQTGDFTCILNGKDESFDEVQ